MNTLPITVVAEFNNRVTAGLFANEDRWLTDEGFRIMAGVPRDSVIATLEVDEGRYDSEGDSYVIELLNICAGDIHHTYADGQ